MKGETMDPRIVYNPTESAPMLFTMEMLASDWGASSGRDGTEYNSNRAGVFLYGQWAEPIID